MSSFEDDIKRIFGISDEDYLKMGLHDRLAHLRADQEQLAKASHVLSLTRMVLEDPDKYFEPVTRMFGRKFLAEEVNLTASLSPSEFVILSPTEETDAFGAFAFPIFINGHGPDGVYILCEMTVDLSGGDFKETWTPYLTLDGEKVTTLDQAYQISNQWNWPLEAF